MQTMMYINDRRATSRVEPRSASTRSCGTVAPAAPVRASNWRAALPALHGSGVVLRELRRSDAVSLHAMLTAAEVSRFISPPPTAVAGFERFIEWTNQQRAEGSYVCFGIVPAGSDCAIGLIQIRACAGSMVTAEWGFALGSSYWGSGLFIRSAELALTFAFTTLGVHRLEARAAVQNGRGNAALRKLGAVKEAVLRRSLNCRGEYLDQALWTLIADEWRPGAEVHPGGTARSSAGRYLTPPRSTMRAAALLCAVSPVS